jgi:hypothetical protein
MGHPIFVERLGCEGRVLGALAFLSAANLSFISECDTWRTFRRASSKRVYSSVGFGFIGTS